MADAATSAPKTTTTKKIVKKVVRRVVKKTKDGKIISSTIEPSDGSSSAPTTTTTTTSKTATTPQAVRRKSLGTSGLQPTDSASVVDPSPPIGDAAAEQKSLETEASQPTQTTATTATPPVEAAAPCSGKTVTPAVTEKPTTVEGPSEQKEEHVAKNPVFGARRKSFAGSGAFTPQPPAFGSHVVVPSPANPVPAARFPGRRVSIGAPPAYIPSPANFSAPSNKSTYVPSPSNFTPAPKAWNTKPTTSSPGGGGKQKWAIPGSPLPLEPSAKATVSRAMSENKGWVPPGSGAGQDFSKMNAVMLRKFREPAVVIQKWIRRFLEMRRIKARLVEARDKRAREAAEAKQCEWLQRERKEKEHEHVAITKVQTLVRAMLAKLRFAREKKRLAELKIQTAAVIRIQTVVRIFLAKNAVVIPRLELQLRTLKKAKAEEVAAVEDWKMEEMRRIHQKYKPMSHEDAKAKEERGQKDYEDSSILAHTLRQENKKMRTELEEMRTEVFDLQNANASLERTLALVEKNVNLVQGALPKLETDHTKLTEITNAFLAKKQQYIDAEQNGRAKVELETSLKNLYLLSAQEMVEMATKSTREPDPRLIPMIKQAAERDFRNIEHTHAAKTLQIQKMEKFIEKKYSGQDEVEEEDDEDVDVQPIPRPAAGPTLASINGGQVDNTKKGEGGIAYPVDMDGIPPLMNVPSYDDDSTTVDSSVHKKGTTEILVSRRSSVAGKEKRSRSKSRGPSKDGDKKTRSKSKGPPKEEGRKTRSKSIGPKKDRKSTHDVDDGAKKDRKSTHDVGDGAKKDRKGTHDVDDGAEKGKKNSHHVDDGAEKGKKNSHHVDDGAKKDRKGTHDHDGAKKGKKSSHSIDDGAKKDKKSTHNIDDGGDDGKIKKDKKKEKSSFLDDEEVKRIISTTQSSRLLPDKPSMSKSQSSRLPLEKRHKDKQRPSMGKSKSTRPPKSKALVSDDT